MNLTTFPYTREQIALDLPAMREKCNHLDKLVAKAACDNKISLASRVTALFFLFSLMTAGAAVFGVLRPFEDPISFMVVAECGTLSLICVYGIFKSIKSFFESRAHQLDKRSWKRENPSYTEVGVCLEASTQAFTNTSKERLIDYEEIAADNPLFLKRALELNDPTYFSYATLENLILYADSRAAASQLLEGIESEEVQKQIVFFYEEHNSLSTDNLPLWLVKGLAELLASKTKAVHKRGYELVQKYPELIREVPLCLLNNPIPPTTNEVKKYICTRYKIELKNATNDAEREHIFYEMPIWVFKSIELEIPKKCFAAMLNTITIQEFPISSQLCDKIIKSKKIKDDVLIKRLYSLLEQNINLSIKSLSQKQILAFLEFLEKLHNLNQRIYQKVFEYYIPDASSPVKYLFKYMLKASRKESENLFLNILINSEKAPYSKLAALLELLKAQPSKKISNIIIDYFKSPIEGKKEEVFFSVYHAFPSNVLVVLLKRVNKARVWDHEFTLYKQGVDRRSFMTTLASYSVSLVTWLKDQKKIEERQLSKFVDTVYHAMNSLERTRFNSRVFYYLFKTKSKNFKEELLYGCLRYPPLESLIQKINKHKDSWHPLLELCFDQLTPNDQAKVFQNLQAQDLLDAVLKDHNNKNYSIIGAYFNQFPTSLATFLKISTVKTPESYWGLLKIFQCMQKEKRFITFQSLEKDDLMGMMEIWKGVAKTNESLSRPLRQIAIECDTEFQHLDSISSNKIYQQEAWEQYRKFINNMKQLEYHAEMKDKFFLTMASGGNYQESAKYFDLFPNKLAELLNGAAQKNYNNIFNILALMKSRKEALKKISSIDLQNLNNVCKAIKDDAGKETLQFVQDFQEEYNRRVRESSISND